jgi:hypothetical protein
LKSTIWVIISFSQTMCDVQRLHLNTSASASLSTTGAPDTEKTKEKSCAPPSMLL